MEHIHDDSQAAEVVCRSTETSNENTSGILKLPVSSSVNGNRELYSGDPATFVISSPSKGFKIYLKQCNYDLAKLSLERDPTNAKAKKWLEKVLNDRGYSKEDYPLDYESFNPKAFNDLFNKQINK